MCIAHVPCQKAEQGPQSKRQNHSLPLRCSYDFKLFCWGLQKTDSQSGNAPERAMKKTLSSRGNKTTLLFKQLPDVPTET